MDKIKIEKNTVQETLIIPLYARKLCTNKFPNLFQDKLAIELIENLEYDWSNIEKQDGVMHTFGALEVAMRQKDIEFEVKNYLKDYPRAAVVNLGCGLDQTGKNCDNGMCKIYNIDFPDVINIRNRLIPLGDREENIATDLNDFSWFDKIDYSKGVILFSAGVFYYFQKPDAKRLIMTMADKFPKGRLVFDSCGKMGLKMMLKTWIKQAKIKDVNAYFYIDDIHKDLANWSNKFKVSSRGYMLGYFSLDDENISGIYRFLAKVGDGLFKMKIICIDF